MGDQAQAGGWYQRGVVAVLAAVSLVIGLWQLNAMGNVWDEYFYYDAARDYARALATGDVSADAWRANFEHPPLGKLVLLPAIRWNHRVEVSDRDAYHAPRVMSVLLSALTVLVVYQIGQRTFGQRAGISAALLFATLPAIVAYAKIVDLDTPMILFFTLAVGSILRWQGDHDRPGRDHSLWWAALFASLAIATKFNASLIVLILIAALAADHHSHPRGWKLPVLVLVGPFIVGGVLYALWPWLWSDPIGQFQATLNHWQGTVRELYFGQYRTPGIEYFGLHFVVGTPLIVLALAGYGIWTATRHWQPHHTTLVAWLLAPFAISLFHLRQDHLRYVLTAYPALALLAALGLWALTDRLAKRWQPAHWCVPAIVAISVLWSLAWIHPYYLNYYNPLVGGTQGVLAHERFELGFYGEGIREATEFINRTAADGATVHYEVIPDDAPYLDRPRLVRMDTPPGADYLIVNSNALHDPAKRDNFSLDGYHVVYEVRAAGAPFVWVYERN